NVILPSEKLALFFKIPFRNTHHAVRNTNKLALFWLCFSVSPSRINSHIILFSKNLRQFCLFKIGFVFSNYTLSFGHPFISLGFSA
ncbi:MAG: hypothetical protein ACYTFW_22765, partial [Planctomycetota bacterium]